MRSRACSRRASSRGTCASPVRSDPKRDRSRSRACTTGSVGGLPERPRSAPIVSDVTVKIQGYDATYDTLDGWRCAEKLVERRLRDTCTPLPNEPAKESAALTMVGAEFSGKVDVVDQGVVKDSDLS